MYNQYFYLFNIMTHFNMKNDLEALALLGKRTSLVARKETFWYTISSKDTHTLTY